MNFSNFFNGGDVIVIIIIVSGFIAQTIRYRERFSAFVKSEKEHRDHVDKEIDGQRKRTRDVEQQYARLDGGVSTLSTTVIDIQAQQRRENDRVCDRVDQVIQKLDRRTEHDDASRKDMHTRMNNMESRILERFSTVETRISKVEARVPR